jgi:hypothetical protein
MSPDTKHLHQLIFNFLKKKTRFKNIIYVNILSASLINFYNLFIFYLSLNFISNSQIQIMLILFNIVVYLLYLF